MKRNYTVRKSLFNVNADNESGNRKMTLWPTAMTLLFLYQDLTIEVLMIFG